jgi:Fe-S oxidoreductase
MFDIDKCDKCGDCFIRCQYVDYSPEAAVEEITALIEGRDADILTQCTTCMACNEYCKKGANPYDLILRLQEEKGILPVPEERMNAFKSMEGMPGQVVWGDPDKPALSLCVLKARLPEAAIESRMFDGLTLFDGGEYFCYSLYLHTARESYVRKNVQKYIDSLASLKKPEIVLLHDDCYTAAVAMAREYGIDVPFRPVHIIEYLLNYVREHRDEVNRLNKKIAYQRPCISRYTPEKEPMLDELFELIGVERVARQHDREDALCCGALYAERQPERAKKFQEINIADAKAYGADAMVILCPICWQRLSQPCRDSGLPPVYITNLCSMALGERPFPASFKNT